MNIPLHDPTGKPMSPAEIAALHPDLKKLVDAVQQGGGDALAEASQEIVKKDKEEQKRTGIQRVLDDLSAYFDRRYRG